MGKQRSKINILSAWFSTKFHLQIHFIYLQWIESSYMASMRFKALRAKKWWQETMMFLNSIRSMHRLKTLHIFDEIEKHNIEPLHLTRISSPETTRTSLRRHRQTYPLSTGCIDFENDDSLRQMSPPIYDDQFLELKKKFRRKKKRKNKQLFQSLTELHKIDFNE